MNIRNISLVRTPEAINEKLKLSEVRYRRLFEAARDGILLVDPITRKITDVNPFMIQLLGYERDAFLGKELWEIGLLKNAQASHEAFDKLEKDGYVRYDNLPFQSREGEVREVEVVSNIYKEDGNDIIQCNIRDITERRRVEKALKRAMIKEQAARAEVDQANRAKDEFLTTMSHELRTPMTHVLGWARMLEGGRLDEATSAKGLQTIVRSAQAEVKLIDDLLDVSRIMTGKLYLKVCTFELVPLIEAAIDAARPVALAGNINLIRNINVRFVPIEGDPHRLQQVIGNLLNNAIKFTPEGGQVEIQLERENSWAVINVRDTGQGIEPEFLPHVFDRLRQADGSRTRAHGGLGLGLAIAQNIVQMHGGTVHAESLGRGNGSTFTVRIPLQAAADIRDSALSGRQHEIREAQTGVNFGSPHELAGLRILAVDGDHDTLEMLKTLLERSGAEVRTSTSADSAVDMLSLWKPDVLVSEIAIPSKSGYWLVREVQEFERTSGIRIPTLALTTRVTLQDRSDIVKAGFTMFVPKPVDPALLLAKLATLAHGAAAVA